MSGLGKFWVPVRGNVNPDVPLMCCWDDCEKHGDNRWRVEVRPTRGAPATIYIFCSEGHRDYHLNSHREYGNRWKGQRL